MVQEKSEKVTMVLVTAFLLGLMGVIIFFTVIFCIDNFCKKQPQARGRIFLAREIIYERGEDYGFSTRV